MPEHPEVLTSLLWIDDEPLMRRAVELAAHECGARIETAANVEEARQRMESTDFHWVVCDYRLGRWKTAEQFVREMLAKGQQIVVLTGDMTAVDPTLGVRVVEKPVLLQDLLGQLTGRTLAGG